MSILKDIYIIDYGNLRIRVVEPNGTIRTLSTIQKGSTFIAINKFDDIYILNEHVIKKFGKGGPDSIITTFKGYSYSGDGGPASNAQIGVPSGFAIDSNGNFFISDKDNNNIRKIDARGNISTVAGYGFAGRGGNGGLAREAKLYGPGAITIDNKNNIFVVESSGTIRKIDNSGIISTYAGNTILGNSASGIAASLGQFSGLGGIAGDNNGNLYVVDCGNNKVRKITDGVNPFVSVPTGIDIGDMLYWNGADWSKISAGTEGQILMYQRKKYGMAYECVPKWVSITPVIKTADVSNIIGGTAISGGVITSYGYFPVTAKGVCWSAVDSTPTIEINAKTVDGSGAGSYISHITGLLPNKSYLVRAYATALGITTYGEDYIVINTTLGLPVLSTASLQLGNGSVISGGNITDDGGYPVTSRGVCWSLKSGATIDLATKTTDSSGVGIYQSLIYGLSPGTTYYLRAYATNATGTTYGNELKFVKNGNIPAFTFSFLPDTSDFQSVHVKGNINTTDNGGSAILQRRICWSTNHQPTRLYDYYDIEADRNYEFSIRKLEPNTTYYARAYIKNAEGLVKFSEEVSFSTLGIGDFYGGGKIAYFYKPGDYFYRVNVPHGLIMSLTDIGTGMWGCDSVTGGSDTSLKGGMANSDTQAASMCNIAAKLCRSYKAGEFTDWYLPTLKEFMQIGSNEVKFNKLSGSTDYFYGMYWSSSEVDYYRAFSCPSDGFYPDPEQKNRKYKIRAVRKF
ncbi:MAG: hypothetical protein JWQ38_641 [Flavipsychrobacter sp.]|nr:hypothetical protein [Flavipsychrobacter sp.]